MKNDAKEELIELPERNSEAVENEIKTFLATEEGQIIKADIELLNSMGFDKKMINKIYILLRPENIERAIDYMTEIDGIYQHDFFIGTKTKDKNLCFICKKSKRNHRDYIPDDLINDIQNNNQINIQQNIIENNIIEINNNKEENNDFNYDECEVCYEEINNEDKELNKLSCGHLFCTQCWYNYLKTSILEAKVDKIKCMNHECKEIITEEFILKHISDNENLIQKYKKFKKRSEIIKDKNKKLCPNPDCDSYLQKSKSKYVQCENGHKYCYECLKPPHGKNSCDQKLEKQFMKWTKGKRVKRCPRCQIYTEKNEGCNHMTCVSCKYQWCWLCEGEYNYNHYSSGQCKGQQFTRADNINQIFKYRNVFGLHKIFKCIYLPMNREFYFDFDCWLKYLMIILFILFGFGIYYFFVTFFYLDEKLRIRNESVLIPCFFINIFTSLAMFISFEILFTAINFPFMLIALIYPKFFVRFLAFYGIGEGYNL